MNRDMKRINKGVQWTTRGQHYKAATALVEEMKKTGDEKYTKKQLAAMKTAKSKELAERIVDMIKSGALFGVFLAAGRNIRNASEHQTLLNEAYEKYLEDPTNDELFRKVEELEDKVANEHSYDDVTEDKEILKALDYHAELTQGFNLFDVCRRKYSGGECCGLYMPEEWWWNYNAPKFGFKCHADWKLVYDKHRDHPTVKAIIKQYGSNIEWWPQPGCSAKFIPYARGASQVLEIQMPDGTWEALLCERVPEVLDKEIKRHLLEFHTACQRLTAEEIKASIPMTVPRTNASDIPGVSHFDFDEWERRHCPIMKEDGWRALCLTIGSKDPLNLKDLITLCDKDENPLETQDFEQLFEC